MNALLMVWRFFHAPQHIQSNLSTAIADLAKRAGIGSAAFFEHFKSVTATSPLLYQKAPRPK